MLLSAHPAARKISSHHFTPQIKIVVLNYITVIKTDGGANPEQLCQDWTHNYVMKRRCQGVDGKGYFTEKGSRWVQLPALGLAVQCVSLSQMVGVRWCNAYHARQITFLAHSPGNRRRIWTGFLCKPGAGAASCKPTRDLSSERAQSFKRRQILALGRGNYTGIAWILEQVHLVLN